MNEQEEERLLAIVTKSIELHRGHQKAFKVINENIRVLLEVVKDLKGRISRLERKVAKLKDKNHRSERTRNND